jgi:hypothetical protein
MCGLEGPGAIIHFDRSKGAPAELGHIRRAVRPKWRSALASEGDAGQRRASGHRKQHEAARIEIRQTSQASAIVMALSAHTVLSGRRMNCYLCALRSPIPAL